MGEHHDIYVRAHTVQLEQKWRTATQQHNRPKWEDYALLFDCETRITADQTLMFGFWRFCKRRNGLYVPLEEGIVHDKLTPREMDALRAFSRSTKADTVEDGYDRIRLYSRDKFVGEVLGISIQAHAFIVCFNAGFDLSRLAVDWETAANGGWSLILSQWRDLDTRQLVPNKYFPRIVIKALNSKTSIIHSTRAPMCEPGDESGRVELWPPGRFLDVRTVLWAMRNRSYSLKSACREFKTAHQKIDRRPTGRVTPEEIEYARNDVACTVDLLNATKQKFDLHQIAKGPDQMFSPASVAKDYLEGMHIKHPSEKVRHG